MGRQVVTRGREHQGGGFGDDKMKMTTVEVFKICGWKDMTCLVNYSPEHETPRLLPTPASQKDLWPQASLSPREICLETELFSAHSLLLTGANSDLFLLPSILLACLQGSCGKAGGSERLPQPPSSLISLLLCFLFREIGREGGPCGWGWGKRHWGLAPSATVECPGMGLSRYSDVKMYLAL